MMFSHINGQHELEMYSWIRSMVFTGRVLYTDDSIREIENLVVGFGFRWREEEGRLFVFFEVGQA